MKSIVVVGLTVALAARASTLSGGELVSGPQAGERVTGFFDFSGVKCGGAKDRYAVGTRPKILLRIPPSGRPRGPTGMRIHADAQVTVIIYQMKPGKVVKANHAYSKGSLNPKAVTTVIADIEKHLK